MDNDKRKETGWYFRHPNHETAKVRLFCLPYAGGGAWIYRNWIRELAPDVAVCAVKLPGRGDRYSDPPVGDLHTLARAVADALAPDLDKPYAIFGHSMGALLAFECLQHIQACAGPPPLRLFASAACAPSRMTVQEPLHRLPDAELLAAMRQRYANPFLNDVDPDLMELLLPPLRADMMALETYVYRPTPPLQCPVTLFAGREDEIAHVDVDEWGEHTTVPPTMASFDSGHFFIHDCEALVYEKIRHMLLT